MRRKTFGDASFFKYERVCGDANGKMFFLVLWSRAKLNRKFFSGVETYRTEKTLPNPHPGTVIDSVSNYGGNLTDEEKQRMANEAADIEAQMRNIFRPGFPFNDPGFNPGFFPSFGPGIPPANPVFGPGFPF